MGCSNAAGEVVACPSSRCKIRPQPLFNALNCRSRDKSVFKIGLFSNKYLMGSIALSITFQFPATALPFFRVALGTVALSLHDWAIIFAVSGTVFIADELRKLIKRRGFIRS